MLGGVELGRRDQNLVHYYNRGGLKIQPSLSHGFPMEILRTHEYDILLVKVGHGEVPHVFTFLICALPLKKLTQT